ncbi:MAG: hypothetical protein SO442_03640 [Prevotella sp.]|nr:hypothetical protein [Prevotella sp.]
MPLNGLRWSRNSGSANCDMPQSAVFGRPGGGCYTLYNKGKKGNLTDDATSSTYRGKTDGTGATWYVTPNPYNESGYLISSSQDVATKPTNCLYAYKDADNYYYLCSTEEESVDLGTHGNSKYYQLPTFQFYTYDQLFALAQKCGYTGTKATGTPTQQNWADLVDKINASRVLSDQNTVSSNETPVHNFVIASRRYHKFLNIDNDGNLHVADKITTSSIFQAEASSASGRTFYSVYHGDHVAFTLYYANNGHAKDFRLMNSNGQYLCVDNEGNVSYSARTSNEDLAKLDNEWVVAQSPYDDNLQYLNVSKTDIRDVQNWYFRIENNTKRIKNISGTPTESNQGGFLTDVDKAALEEFDAEKKTTIANADVFSNSTNLRDAANIWHVTLAYAGKDDSNNQPIGIVSTLKHSLYYIQNVNSKKFIGNPSSTSQLMPLISETADKSQRALFYLVPKDENNDNGVYAMMLLDRSNSKTEEVPLGYLDIADTDDNGVPDNTVSSDYNQAALVYQKATSITNLADDAYNWSFHRARFIQARTADSQNASAFKGYRYVSLWFPFDIVNTDPDITLYIAKWLPDYSGVKFYQTASLPAGYGAVALAKDDDAHKMLKFYIDEATGYRSDISEDVLKGVSEGEDFVLSDEASSPYYRKGIYVFSETLADKSYTDIDLSLGYPADKFLMANRCYVKATTESEKTVTKGKAFTFCFDDGSTTDIRDALTHQEGHMVYYDLQGRRVSNPSKGIYITNGKKIIIK